MRVCNYSLIHQKLAVILILIFFSNCGEKPKDAEVDQIDGDMASLITDAKETANENWNISFLLDLSDRIDTAKYPNPAMEFYQRDASYILSIAKVFDAHLRSKPLRTWDDKIQIFFDPEPSNNNINVITQELKYQFTRQNATEDILEKFIGNYATNPTKIYELAIEDGRYVGSDTWGFFKNKVKPYCIESNHRNILVILTDGYIFHVDNKKIEGNRTSFLTPEEVRRKRLNDASWQAKFKNEDYGFIPAINGLATLEILVLNLNPSKYNAYEEDVLKAYWSDWFEQMGVKRYEIQTTDLPTNIEMIIKNFILR